MKMLFTGIMGAGVIGAIGLFPLAYAENIYYEMIKDARGREKPAHLEKKDEMPVLVKYPVSDTAAFVSKTESPVKPQEETGQIDPEDAGSWGQEEGESQDAW